MSTRLLRCEKQFRDSVGSFGSSCLRVSGMGPRAPGDLNFIPATWLRDKIAGLSTTSKDILFNACNHDELLQKRNEGCRCQGKGLR